MRTRFKLAIGLGSLVVALAVAPSEAFRGGAGGGARAGGSGARTGGSAPRAAPRATSTPRPAPAARPAPARAPQSFSRSPSAGGFRPSTGVSARPNVMNRPGAGGAGVARSGGWQNGSTPSFANRPGGISGPGQMNRPGITATPGVAPRREPIRTPGGVANRGQVNDFLGMGGSVAERRNLNVNRAGIAAGGQTNINRINVGNRNTVISNRPQWANISGNQINRIGNNWQRAVTTPINRGNIHNWRQNHPDRVAHWNNWGNHVRNNWRYNDYHRNYFNRSWWDNHRHDVAGWHYWHRFPYHNYGYWWGVPTWAGLTSWFTWGAAPAAVWSEPIYYDYGAGGNVVYQDNSVYVNGQDVAPAPEFAESAAALATVAPPASEAQAEESDWMPLGTFAVSANDKEGEPTRFLQLAVNRDGIISGTLYNSVTDKTATVQGRVDKDTQRVALRIGESQDVVGETGLYNLTQDEAPLLIHFGPDRVENYLLVRLPPPPGEDTAGQPGPG